MKRIIVLSIACILCALALVSCKQSRQEEAKSSVSEASEAVRSFSGTELLKAFEDAEKEYEWIRGLQKPPYKPGGKRASVSEVDYEELSINGVSGKSDLKKYLQKYFSEEIAESLVNKKSTYELFKDIDGKLYCIGGHTGLRLYAFQERSVVIKEQSDKKVVFTLDMTAVHSYTKEVYKAQHDYINEKQSGGDWVFTDFELPYDVIFKLGE
jgi:ABC-type enterochelin transport system substrate-binding protein